MLSYAWTATPSIWYLPLGTLVKGKKAKKKRNSRFPHDRHTNGFVNDLVIVVAPWIGILLSCRFLLHNRNDRSRTLLYLSSAVWPSHCLFLGFIALALTLCSTGGIKFGGVVIRVRVLNSRGPNQSTSRTSVSNLLIKYYGSDYWQWRRENSVDKREYGEAQVQPGYQFFRGVDC